MFDFCSFLYYNQEKKDTNYEKRRFKTRADFKIFNRLFG